MTDSRLSKTRRTILASTATLATGSTTAGAANKSSSTSSENESESGSESKSNADDSDDADESEESTETMDATRFVHLAPDVGDIDIQVNGYQEWPTASKFHKSKYQAHEPGSTYTVTVSPTDSDAAEPLLEQDVTLGEGAHTLALVGERCAVSNHPLDLVTLTDDYSTIPEGEASIQFIHSSTDAPTLDVLHKDGTLLLESLDFGTAETVTLPADGSQQVVMLAEAGTTNILSKVPIDPTAGQAHTAFVVGYTNPDAAPSSVADPLPLTLGFDTTSPPNE